MKRVSFINFVKNFSTKLIKANDIKIMIKRKISEDLFSYSYDYVGDLAKLFLFCGLKVKKKKQFLFQFYEIY